MNIFKSFVQNLLNKKQRNSKCISGNEETGNDFANNMIQNALDMCSSTTNSVNNIQTETNVESQVISQQTDCIKIEPKYFSDNGIQYKLENGKMFKQSWKPVSNEQTDEFGNIIYSKYRIINKETGKQMKSSKYIIEYLDWQPLEIS